MYQNRSKPVIYYTIYLEKYLNLSEVSGVAKYM